MDYKIFDNMKIKGTESDQEFMERILNQIIEKSATNSYCNMTINEMMKPEFISCSYDFMMLNLKFHVYEWTLNPYGMFHGGLITTACDITMGMLARFFNKGIGVVTVELSINFLRGITSDENCLFCAKLKKNGKRVKFTACDVYSSKNQLLATATGVFM